MIIKLAQQCIYLFMNTLILHFSMIEPKQLCLFNVSTRHPMRSTWFQLKKPFGPSIALASKKHRLDLTPLDFSLWGTLDKLCTVTNTETNDIVNATCLRCYCLRHIYDPAHLSLSEISAGS